MYDILESTLLYNFRAYRIIYTRRTKTRDVFRGSKNSHVLVFRYFSASTTRRFLIKRDARERNKMHYFTKRLCSFSLGASQSAFTAPSGIRLQMECKLEEYTKETTEPCIQEILRFRISFQFCQIIQCKRSSNKQCQQAVSSLKLSKRR